MDIFRARLIFTFLKKTKSKKNNYSMLKALILAISISSAAGFAPVGYGRAGMALRAEEESSMTVATPGKK